MNWGLGLSLCILSDRCWTELLIVLVRHYAQRFDCVNSFEITCSAALTDRHGRASQHYKACLHALTPVSGCSARYTEETGIAIVHMFDALCLSSHWSEPSVLSIGELWWEKYVVLFNYMFETIGHLFASYIVYNSLIGVQAILSSKDQGFIVLPTLYLNPLLHSQRRYVARISSSRQT